MWMSSVKPDVSVVPTSVKGAVVAVAIPARNEVAMIEGCLHALDVAAAKAIGATVRLVVCVNNSSDGTTERARRFRPRTAQISVCDIALPPHHAHAGGARRAALDDAAMMLPAHGILMTTDADSRVDPDWILANLVELAAGADAVAGTVAFDDADLAALPDLPTRALEWRLAELQAQLGSLIDPRPHDPWPNHLWAWGASMALTLSAYRQIGGLPLVPLAEDRALAAALERDDLKLRHSHLPRVITSARLDGRAPGGLADLLQSYLTDAETPCDAALEPTVLLLRRLVLRARLRRLAEREGLMAAATHAQGLGCPAQNVTGFGALWSAVEARLPSMQRQRVLPSALAAEVALAERWISRIDRPAADQADIAASARAA